jgi:hypothetical protein
LNSCPTAEIRTFCLFCVMSLSRGARGGRAVQPGVQGRKGLQGGGHGWHHVLLGMGRAIRSSGFQSTVRAKLGLLRVTSFLMWLNCCSCDRGSCSGCPGKRGLGAAKDLLQQGPLPFVLLCSRQCRPLGVVRASGAGMQAAFRLGGGQGAEGQRALCPRGLSYQQPKHGERVWDPG